MTVEQSNIFAKGTQALQVRENLVYKPTNDDYCFLGKIKSSSAGSVVVNKAWDADKTKDFNVTVNRQDGTAINSSEIEVNQYISVHRKPNDQFLSIAPNLFSMSGIGIYAYHLGAELTKESFSGLLFCGVLGKTWKKTNLKAINNYSVLESTPSAIAVASDRDIEIYIDDEIEIISSRIVLDNFGGSEIGKAYPVSVVAGKLRTETEIKDVFCIINQSVLAAGYLCCEETGVYTLRTALFTEALERFEDNPGEVYYKKEYTLEHYQAAGYMFDVLTGNPKQFLGITFHKTEYSAWWADATMAFMNFGLLTYASWRFDKISDGNNIVGQYSYNPLAEWVEILDKLAPITVKQGE